LSAPANSGRELVTVGLQEAEGSYGIDIQAFEKTLTGKSKLLLFCNPHNPVGRVFGKEEIRQVAEICADRDMVICSDEIHCDLILDDKKHVPTASLSAEIAARTITLMSPSKTFNLAGLNFAFAIIPNTELRRNFIREVREKLPPVNALGLAAGLAAYRDCEQWRSELLDYLRGNRDLLEKFIKEETPGLSMNHVEATYLGWIDVRELNKEDPAKFFERVGVGLSDGKYFGAEGFLRINFGCPRSTLTEGLERIKRAVEDY
jgi:cystathionine beta-lyase